MLHRLSVAIEIFVLLIKRSFIVINDIIVEYLKSNRRLVVPEFGAFVTKESGEIIFSELLRNDDGVLSSLLTARGMSEIEAAVTIDRYIFEARNEMDSYGYCRFGALGTLRRDGDKLKLYQIKERSNTPAEPVAEPLQSNPAPTEAPRNEQQIVTEVAQTPQTPKAPQGPIMEKRVVEKRTTPTPQRRGKRVDFVMILAVVILLVALIAIGFGYYVSTLGEVNDEAAMEALRVAPIESTK